MISQCYGPWIRPEELLKRMMHTWSIIALLVSQCSWQESLVREAPFHAGLFLYVCSKHPLMATVRDKATFLKLSLGIDQYIFAFISILIDSDPKNLIQV